MEGGTKIMCSDCYKEKKCDSACVSLMRVPYKDLTKEELERVRTWRKFANDDMGY